MLSRTLLVLAAAVVVVGCEQSTAPSQMKAPASASLTQSNTTKLNVVVPISGTIYNSCNGEIADVSGKAHEAITTTVNGSTTTTSIHINYDDLQGVGETTGVTYHINAAAQEYQTSDWPVYSVTENVNELIVTQGSTQNWTAHVTETFGYDGTNYYFTMPRANISCQG